MSPVRPPETNLGQPFRTATTQGRARGRFASGLLASKTLLALAAAAPAAAQQASAADMDRLLAVIEAQQAQIDALRAEVQAMKATQTAQAQAQARAPAAAAPAPAPVVATVAPEDADREAQMVTEGFVWRDSAGRSLTFSGQLNPALNIVDDGKSTEVMIVDNDTSNSRLRFDVDAPFGQSRVGGTFEIAVSPNNSYAVSQIDKSEEAEFDVRRAEVTFRDDRWGRVMFGKGSVAADDVAEYDLSLVAGPIMYSGVADIVGGVLFTDGTDYTDITVGDAFFNFDPGRSDRIRYDTPMFGPVQGSVSWGTDDQWAAAVTLGGDYGDWSGWDLGDVTVLAAAGVYGEDGDGIDYTYLGSASFLHNPTGLSLTFSGGRSELDEGDDPYNLYVKLGYDTEIWPIGPTGFGIDYTYGKNLTGDGDEGTSWGLAAVQKVDGLDLDFYTQLRFYDLDTSAYSGVENIVVGTFGTKFTF
jgi:hypothetical protein